jgi:chromosome partitioning protein
MRTVAVVNQKGGCGKTTTAINLAAFLAVEGRKTLIVDMDPQGHASLGLLPAAPDEAGTIADVLAQRINGRSITLADVTRRVHQNLDVAPADIALSAVPEQVAGVPNRERLLADVLSEVDGTYDYVIVDCPPQVGLLTFSALMACSEAIVPVDPSFFSLHGIAKVLETFDRVERQTGHAIAMRALITLYSGRTPFVRDVAEEIRKHFAGRHFTTVIRHSIKLAEAASHGLPITGYATRCAGFEDYEALAAEVLAMEEPSRTADGVVFAIEAPHATRVQLVGDFNGWSLDGSDMSRSAGVWTSVVKLEPGRYRYRYVVDGSWQSDPANPVAEPSPYGGQNSVVVLPGGGASR